MKKIFISILFVVGVINFAQSQAKPSFGFKAGLNFPTLSEDTDIDNSTGFHVGAVFHVPIKKFGFMAEAVYSREGAEDLDLDFLNVPLMVTYKIVPGLRLHVGPQFKVKLNTDISLEEFEVGANENLEDDIKDLNFDGVAGVEYKFPAVGIFVQARYVFGLGDLGDDEIETTQNVFQLSVGYRF